MTNCDFIVPAAVHVIQQPRFYGIKTGRQVFFFCSLSTEEQASVQWYRADAYNKDPAERMEVKRGRVHFGNMRKTQNAYLYINNVKLEDSGFYFCKINNHTWGAGSEMRVVSKWLRLFLGQ